MNAARKLLGIAALAAMGACGSPVVQGQAPPGNHRPGDRADQVAAAAQENTAATSAGAAGAGDAATSADGGRAPPLPVTDVDLAESTRSRDPFRSFASEFVPHSTAIPAIEHTITLRQYTLDQLQLIAVVLTAETPYAMVLDPDGTGWVIHRGEYVGRPDTVSGAEGIMPHQVPWRVSRISGSRVTRDANNNLAEISAEVVFELEDRLNPNAPRTEHVLVLTPPQTAHNEQPAGATTDTSASPQIPPGMFMVPGTSPFLPGGTSPGARGAGRTGPPSAIVQSYTQVTPAQPAPPPQTSTVLIQTGPHGEMNVTQPGANGASPQAPQGPPNPYQPPGAQPSGGSGPQLPPNSPPPVVVTDGPTFPGAGLPTSGLPR